MNAVLRATIICTVNVRCRHDGGESESCNGDAIHKLFPLLELGQCTRQSTDVCAKRHTTVVAQRYGIRVLSRCPNRAATSLG